MKTIILITLTLMASFSHASIIIGHTAPNQFEAIPHLVFEQLRDSFDIYYGHTSHGSQILTGLQMLSEEDPLKYNTPVFHENFNDLGHIGDLTWEVQTRAWLGNHPETNVVMWAWCAGCSDNTEAGINIYLSAMNQLELDFPHVSFIYMTGHLDGTGLDGNLYRSNNQIRDYCLANNKVLYDFADIESWDPAGNFYPDETDACGWCAAWCSQNTCPSCAGCAHSHCFNCYQKGKSFWWLLYQISGLQASSASPDSPAFSFVLNQNHPNPFNPYTEFRLTIKEPGSGTLAVFDLAGNRIKTLYEGHFESGVQFISWDANDSSGQRLSSGVYFCSLQIGGQIQRIKMTLLK